jgi:hypothetical protein
MEVSVTRTRLKKLGAKLVASPFFAAFAATKLAETLIVPSPWAWAGVFLLASAFYAVGHFILDSLNSQVQKMADNQATLPDYQQ